MPQVRTKLFAIACFVFSLGFAEIALAGLIEDPDGFNVSFFDDGDPSNNRFGPDSVTTPYFTSFLGNMLPAQSGLETEIDVTLMNDSISITQRITVDEATVENPVVGWTMAFEGIDWLEPGRIINATISRDTFFTNLIASFTEDSVTIRYPGGGALAGSGPLWEATIDLAVEHFDPVSVPEPSTWLIWLLGLCAIVFSRRLAR